MPGGGACPTAGACLSSHQARRPGCGTDQAPHVFGEAGHRVGGQADVSLQAHHVVRGLAHEDERRKPRASSERRGRLLEPVVGDVEGS